MEMTIAVFSVDTRNRALSDSKTISTFTSSGKSNESMKSPLKRTTGLSPMPRGQKSKKRTSMLTNHQHPFLPNLNPGLIVLKVVCRMLNLQIMLRLLKEQTILVDNWSATLAILASPIWATLSHIKNTIAEECKQLYETYQPHPKKEAMGVNRPPNKVSLT